jgi:hypothetical protein
VVVVVHPTTKNSAKMMKATIKRRETSEQASEMRGRSGSGWVSPQVARSFMVVSGDGVEDRGGQQDKLPGGADDGGDGFHSEVMTECWPSS